MDNWESMFDDTRRAKSGGTADTPCAPSMTRDQQDQNADMEAASVSQRPLFSSILVKYGAFVNESLSFTLKEPWLIFSRYLTTLALYPNFKCNGFQDLGIGEGMNLSKDDMAAQFKSHIEKLNARYIDLDQKLQETDQKKQELKLRYEQQQNTLLQYQMNLEQLSTQYEAEMNDRDNLVTK